VCGAITQHEREPPHHSSSALVEWRLELGPPPEPSRGGCRGSTQTLHRDDGILRAFGVWRPACGWDCNGMVNITRE
jgi:hypothetical protein